MVDELVDAVAEVIERPAAAADVFELGGGEEEVGAGEKAGARGDLAGGLGRAVGHRRGLGGRGAGRGRSVADVVTVRGVDAGGAGVGFLRFDELPGGGFVGGFFVRDKAAFGAVGVVAAGV